MLPIRIAMCSPVRVYVCGLHRLDLSPPPPCRADVERREGITLSVLKVMKFYFILFKHRHVEEKKMLGPTMCTLKVILYLLFTYNSNRSKSSPFLLHRRWSVACELRVSEIRNVRNWKNHQTTNPYRIALTLFPATCDYIAMPLCTPILFFFADDLL